MKKLLLLSACLLSFFTPSFSQTSVSCATGSTPVVPTGWTLSGSATVSGSAVQLTSPVGSQAGQLYYSTPLTLTGCGGFTVDFDFQIIPSTSSFAIADGIACWIINPLSGFIGGGGISLPTNPNGLVFVLDTYDNDGVPNDPLVSLYGYPSGFTGTYTEGTATNRIGSTSNQTFIDDGGWHHIKMTYNGGNVKVYYNYSATPNISGYFPLATTGYFGFSASTGGAWSTQSVRNIYFTYNTVTPISGPSVMCMGTTATYTDATPSGTWSSSNTSVVVINPTTGVATPIGPGTATITYAYSSTCTATFPVTVDATTLATIAGPATVCPGTPATLTNTTSGGTWSSSTPTIGTIGSATGIANGILAGTTTITYTMPVGCYTTSALTINTAPSPITVTPSPASVCNNATLALTAGYSTPYNLIPPNGWENGVPTTGGTPVSLWNYIGATSSYWYQMPGGLTTSPTTGGAYAGNYVADFNCRSLPVGSTATIYSPSFSMTGVNTATLSFWLYRDVSGYNTAGYNLEGVTAYVNTSPSLTGATTLGFVPRRGGAATTGSLTGTSTVTTSGWQQYTATIPASFTGTTNYILFSAYSQNGDNIYMDSVMLTGTASGVVWSPSIYLFNDAATTTAYTGGSINPVYIHPTGITAITPQTYSVTATNGVCSSTGTTTVTLNPNPVAITGVPILCIGATSSLSDATAGGTWSSSNIGIATIGSSTGIAFGVATGTATITYSVGGCYTTTVVTVVSNPSAIGGVLIACLGSTTNLSNGVAGGSWSSSNTAVGTIGSLSGVVAGLSLGTTIITYGFSSCIVTAVVTVNPYPSAITGTFSLCTGTTTPLASTPGGGIWTSSTTSIATIGVISGIVNASSVGTTTISYRVAGCSVTQVVSVVAAAPVPVGPSTVCIGYPTATYTDATTGGTWSSTNTAVGTIVSTTGVLTGLTAGTTTVVYTIGSACTSSKVVTVVPLPPAITGTFTVCQGASILVSDPIPLGSWDISPASVATIGAGSGIITAASTGSTSPAVALVTYTVPSGCIVTQEVTVNPIPPAIGGTLYVCQGGTSALSDATTGGTWVSGNTSVATIDGTTGVVNGVSGYGTSTITYTAPTGCYTTSDFTVNAIPAAISGAGSVCIGSCTPYTDASPGGGWSSSDPLIATVSGTGSVCGIAAGTATITYQQLSGCYVTQVITVTPGVNTISGSPGLGICVGGTTTLSTTTPGVTWSSSAPLTASIGASTGFVIGSAAGTATMTATATSTGCTATAVVTVNTLPGTIIGALNVCIGNTTALTNGTPGGTWTSSLPAIGTIDVTTGIAGGIAAGTTTITYSLGTGCTTTAVLTVNALPVITNGASVNICSGSTFALIGSPGGGTWVSSTVGVVSAGIGSGTLTGGATAGTATITYTLLPSGCNTTTIVTCNALPFAPSGPTNVCVGGTITLSSTAGNTWSSSNTTVASVLSPGGVVTGNSSGTATITTTIPSTGCYRTTVVLVNPLPSAITGPNTVCEGAQVSESSSPPGGTWTSTSTANATIVAGTGLVTGLLAGTTTIVYTLGTTCSVSRVITVNPIPGPIGGLLSLCQGLTTTLNGTPATGTWSIGPSSVATIGVGTGIVNGNAAGTATVTYTLATTCKRNAIVTVNGLPSAISGIPVVCVGSTTTLNCTPAGGNWTSQNGGIASVGLSSGVVTGNGVGTTIITYSLGTGCIQTIVVTVNPLPGPITGGLSFSEGGTSTVSSSPAGGTWTSSNPAIVTTAPGGLLSSPSCGTATITYTLSTGCRTTAIATSNCLPGVVTGAFNVCIGSTTALHCSPLGGTWTSGNPAAGTIDPTTGVLTGIATGTTKVTYTLPTLTQQYAIITVNPLPAPISGTVITCQGTTTPLGSSPAGGIWTSTNTIVATVNPATGAVSGLAAGTTTVSYTLSTGCAATQTVVINQLPATITGTFTVCEASSTTLSSATPGGVTWSTASANASVGVTTGSVTGINAGTATITCYTSNGCMAFTDVTINALPAPITGNQNVCVGFTTTLNSATASGVWTSSNSAVGPISPLGVVSGLAQGTTNITYNLPATGCYKAVVVTVNANPLPITGSSGFCNFTQSLYTTATPGTVTWGSVTPGILTIDPATGIATGVSVGTGTITVATAAGCTASKNIEIIIAPYIITGPDNVCIGSCVTLGNIITGGTWSCNNPSAGPVNASTGEVCGISSGVSTVTYALSISGCYTTHDVTVNGNPTSITGPLGTCEGGTTTLDNSTGGGTWSSSNTAVGTVDPTSGTVYGVSEGSTTISYILPTSCYSTVNVTINPLPAPISGNPNVCVGSMAPYTSATGGGLWSSTAMGIAYINSAGEVTGMDAGTATISYTLGTGCALSQDITVNPLPAGITGAHSICQNDSTILNDITPNGVWVSSDPAIASISSAGVVTGLAPGSVIISYMLPTSCAATYLFTVYQVPAHISGSLLVCAGFATNLTDSTPGGVWNSDPAAASVGTIHHLTGVLTGITPGTVNITYTLGTGCRTNAIGTVIVLPSTISGTTNVCVGRTIALSDADAGGSWSSSNTSKAIIDAVSGVVTGVSAGTVTISYLVGTGCFNVLNITVNPLPANITGPTSVCEGSTVVLADATPGGTWSNTPATVATINTNTGLLTGISANTTIVTYMLPTGCIATRAETVNMTPAAIAGSGYICLSSTVQLTNTTPGGAWSSSNVGVATISSTGLVTPVTLGTAYISYSLPTGCLAMKMVTVSPLPIVYNVTGGGSYCAGGNGVHIKLDSSQSGVSYELFYGSSATGFATGTGHSVDFGLLTMAGVYTVQATYALSGCQRDMAGSANVIITPLVAPTVAVNTGGSDSSCPGQTVHLTPQTTSAGTAPTYQWKVNGVSVSTADNYSFIPADGDNVTVSMISNGQCISTTHATGTRTLHVLPWGMPSISVLANPGDSICQFSPVTFTALPEYGGAAPIYTWKVNNIVVSSGAEFMYIPVDADVVSVQMVSDYLCRTAPTATSSDVPMTVDSIRIPHVSIIADSGLVAAPGKPITLRAMATNAGPNPAYQWKVNGHPVPGATNQIYTTAFHDYDSVTCVVVSSGACHNIGTFDWVYVSTNTLSVQSVNGESDVRLIPNPNSGSFLLKGTIGNTDEDQAIEITDMLGQVVYNKQIKAVKGKIDEQVSLPGSLANGMYLLNLHSGSEHIIFHFVIEQ